MIKNKVIKVGFVTIYIIIWILSWYVSAFAYTFYNKDNSIKFHVDLKEEIRFEYWDTFDKTYAQDNFNYNKDYSFTSSKMRVGAGFTSSILEGYAQLNWTQFFGLPDDAAFGLGALYYKFNGNFGGPATYPDKSENIGYGALSQLWLRIMPPIMPGFSLKFGRFLYFSGLEAGLPKNKELRWIKKFRVSQRMIGPFDWSRVGRAFDGIVLSYDYDFLNLTTSYMHPTAGGFYLKRDDWRENGKSSHRIDIITATISIKDDNPYIPDTDAQLFYYYYNDKRKVNYNVKLINGHDYTSELSGLGDCEIHMLGAHIIHVHDIGAGIGDILLWGGYQWGNWGRGISNHDHILNHDAWAFSAEMGYKFKNLPWRPWIRAGYFYGSGDSDPDDNNHNTFFMMIPTLRIYSLTPSYTFMNTNYYFSQIILKPGKKVIMRSDINFVRLSSDEDFWYLGSGMMRPDKGSYAAVGNHINSGDNELLKMLDISIFIKNFFQYNMIKMDIDFYISHIWGDNVIEDVFQKSHHLTFFYAELRLRF